jgi:hypothetical protein
MKPAFVSVLLVLLAGCELPTEPSPPKLPRMPDQTAPVVIEGRVVYSGRVVHAATTNGLEGANVRVIEAHASVGTVETGRYRLVLPATYRGRAIAVNVRAIGFKPQTRMVMITNDVVTVDFSLADDALVLSCYMGFR